MEEVQIPVSLLEQIHDTVETAYWFSYTFDLQEHYRKQSKTQPKESKLTTSLGGAQGVAASFIEIAKTEEKNEQSTDAD